MEQPAQFSAAPLSAQGSYGDEDQACSSRVLQLSNSAEILPRVASGREQEASLKILIFFADYQIFRTVTLIAPSTGGD